MLNRRWRPVLFSALAVLGIWAVAMAGYTMARRAKMTAEKVKAYTESLNLTKLSATERAKAIRALADKLNALSIEERRKARAERLAWGLFDQMTDAEKEAFVEATMQTGFKQMLTAFEQLPDEKRRRTIDDAVRRLREGQSRLEGGPGGTNGPPIVSDELRARIRTIGLKTFYSQSSAQTKAEVAPLLEEMQRAMESGRMLRGRP
jgi:hypothetical protein